MYIKSNVQSHKANRYSNKEQIDTVYNVAGNKAISIS